MRILALDPSLSCIGWALFDTEKEPDLVEWGKYKPEGDSLDEKLHDAFEWTRHRLDLFADTATAIEVPVMHRNAKTLRDLAQLCGVLRLPSAHWENPCIEILPSQRLTVLGLRANLRRADAKREVLRLVNVIYSLDLTPKDNDAADAIAVGLAAMKKLKLEAMVAWPN